jgi:hypothetical protein
MRISVGKFHPCDNHIQEKSSLGACPNLGISCRQSSELNTRIVVSYDIVIKIKFIACIQFYVRQTVLHFYLALPVNECLRGQNKFQPHKSSR